jgi:hypothetical protein
METGDGSESGEQQFFFCFEGDGIIMEKMLHGGLHYLYSLPTTATVSKSRREKLTGHVTRSD